MAARSQSPKTPSDPLKLPKLTEHTIQQLATAQSYERGYRYYQNGAITHPMRQAACIWADCYGSAVYQTRAVLNSSGIAELDCTCPYDWGGACKHQVALLLTYVHRPEDFYVIPPLRELLVNHSREDLLSLLEQVLQQQPDLLISLEIAAEVSAPQLSGKPIDTTAYRRKVQQALRGDEMRVIAKALAPALTMAEQLYASGDRLNAGCFYQVLLSEITIGYDSEMQYVDYDGEIAGFSQDAVAGLVNCLAEDKVNAETRQIWLNALLEGVLKDLELGGVDFAAGATDGLIEQSTATEWQHLDALIRQKIEQTGDRWQRDALTRLLAERYQQLEQPDAADAIMLDLGSPQQQVFVLVRQGRYDPAIALAQQHFSSFPGLVYQLADALLAAGQQKKALRYITDSVAAGHLLHPESWLAKYYGQYGDAKTQLKWEEAYFTKSPSLGNYQQLRRLAEPLGSWAKVQKRLLKQLTDDRRWVLLVEIAIEEQDFDRAIQLLKQLDGRQQQIELKLKIAKTIEKTQPETALELYEQVIHTTIQERNRAAYRKAVEYLKSVQKLKKLSKSASAWKSYVQAIREQYPTFRALHDELTQI